MKFDPEQLYFIPLGGANHFGMNLNLYGYQGKWLLIDCGLGFADDSLPGVELILPDPSFCDDYQDDLVGLFITHAHEDHVGAVAHLWPHLKCPVYTTPFTAAILRHKLREQKLESIVPLIEVPLSGTIDLAPFTLDLINITHSIPEPNLLKITTDAGVIVHTGDWKIDPDPVVGELTDIDALKQIGDDGVLALIGDSTGALTPGTSGSEADLLSSFTEVFAPLKGRIVVTCFSSNMARLETISKAASACNRHVALVGYSLWRMEKAARQTGYLNDLPTFLTEQEAASTPRDNIVFICTGSQADQRAALYRLAHNEHPRLRLHAEDTVIFSARMIPGNEKDIIRMQNKLSKMGVEIISEDDAHVHVSGHPARDEVAQMYEWIRPQIAIPVHGEAHYIQAHAHLAEECGVPRAFQPENGVVICLTSNGGEIVGHVPTAVLAVDGNRLIPCKSEIFTQRRKLSYSGVTLVTIVLDHKGRILAAPELSSMGILEPNDNTSLKDLSYEIETDLESLPLKSLKNNDSVRELTRRTVRNFFYALCGKKPIVKIHLIRV